jgi:hypothetical protein
MLERLVRATNDHDLDALTSCFALDYRNETPVGSRVVQRLLGRGLAVRVLTRDVAHTTTEGEERLQVVQGDVRYPATLERAMDGVQTVVSAFHGFVGSGGVTPASEADDADVKRELARINKLQLQTRARLAELDGCRAVSAQFEPMTEQVKEYCALIPDRLDLLTFEHKPEVLQVLQAEFTLEKDGQLRILLVLPTGADVTEPTTWLR